MTTKVQAVLLVAMMAFGVYLWSRADWFAGDGVRVASYVRPPLAAKRYRPASAFLGRPVSPIAFTLNRKCRMTEVQVFYAAELATNKYAHPVWHLVSNSASYPTKAFYYGGNIRGMRPGVPNAQADPLEPDVPYRLVLRLGKTKIDYDFVGPPAIKKTRR